MSFFDIGAGFKFLCSACFICAGIASATAADKLTAAEIRKLLSGTYRVSVADSVSAIAVFTSGNGISVTTNKGEKDTGRWSISGNKVCVQFKHMLDRQNKCSSLINDGGAIRGNGFTARRN
jgi:hypothetical protein